jgi:Leucine-rich repeat (LRR) protein
VLLDALCDSCFSLIVSTDFARVTSQKLENAKKLGVLSLSEHGLDSIPPQVFSADLVKLRTIDLSKNNLKNLGEIDSLKELKSLNLDNNKLYAGSLGQITNLTKLQNLSLASNFLSKFPPVDSVPTGQRHSPEPLPELPMSLKQINLSYNSLMRVPRSLCSASLTKLEKIDLSNNELAAIPEEIALLTNLQDLNLDNNLLVSLPEAIGGLKNLKALSLKENKLNVKSTLFNEKNPQPLPRTLFTDTLLIDLNLHGNDMTNTQLNQFDGFQEFLNRRQKVKSKTLTNLDVCGLK